jgi:hypothetical protein
MEISKRSVTFCQRRLCIMCQTLDWGICIYWLMLCVDFWGLLTKTTCARSTVLAVVPGWPVHFTAHKQPFCWNFLYHPWIVLSIGGYVWYFVRNLSCIVTVDSVLANFKTEHFLIPCTHHFLSWLPPNGETYKYIIVPITRTNLERFCTY